MIEEILPQLYRIEVPLPGNPLKAINSYVIKTEARNLIIDTGFNQKECRDVLDAGIAELGIDLNKTDFFATHLHGDHFGLIPMLASENSKAYMGVFDAKLVEGNSSWNNMLKNGTVSGFPVEQLETAITNHPGRKHAPDKDMKLTHVEDGDVIEIGDFVLTCLHTPGHSPGHICLYEANRKIFFSGDHILGDITPNIQVWSKEDNPLANYMSSLSKVAKMEVEFVLPGHRGRIESLVKRVDALKAHHLTRCKEVLKILKQGQKNAFETAAQMSWDIVAESWDDFPIMQKWFATGEGAAHLRFLENRELIVGEMSPDEIFLYSLSKNQEGLRSMD